MRSRLLGSTVALLLVLTACGGGGEGTDTTAAADETVTTAQQEQGATSTTGEMAETSTTMSEEMNGVHGADSDLGEILVDPDGFTLYVFTQDSNGQSVCNDACADLWPPVPGDTTVGSDLDSSMFGTITRDDGTAQLSINGMPLYRYTPDAKPGDTTGQGFNDVWFVVDPTGSMMEAAASNSTAVDYDY